MNKSVAFIFSLFSLLSAYSQQKNDVNSDALLKSLSQNACKCIDSVKIVERSKSQISHDIHECIKSEVSAYQLGSKLFGVDTQHLSANKSDTITIDADESSSEFRKYYYEMERYLMENCKSIKNKIATSEVTSNKSLSDDKEAIKLYESGIEESKKENYKKALKYFEEAVKIDPLFAFAWDNIGVCYRKLDNYDKAIESYKKSLEIDPKGLLPLQNLAIAYRFKKEYKNAIKAYENLADVDKDNPETFYGIGQIYALALHDYEKGLVNLCKSYNLYVSQNSPYRTDAEKVIQMIYTEMKKQGKEEKFNEILKANNISPK